MTTDDQIRAALDAAAPDAPGDPAAVRAALGPRMMRARRVRTVRTVAAGSVLTLAVLGGGAAALTGVFDDPATDLAVADPTPSPAVGDTTPPAVSDTTDEASHTEPADDAAPTEDTVDHTGVGDDPASRDPSDASGDPAAPVDSTGPSTGGDPTDAPSPDPSVPTPEPTVAIEIPTDTPTVTGPHATPCGEVSFFVVDGTVTIDSHTVVDGYRWFAEGDGTEQVHVTWDKGPADDCQVEAHLEVTGLIVEARPDGP